MKKTHLTNLQCPVCGKEINLIDSRINGLEISRGKLICESMQHFFPIVLGRPIILKDNHITSWYPPINRVLGIDKKENFRDSLLRLSKIGVDKAISQVDNFRLKQNKFNDENFTKYFDKKIINKAKYRKSGQFFQYHNLMRFKKYSILKFIRNSGNDMFNKFLDIGLSLRPKKILDLASGAGSWLSSLVNNLDNIEFAYGCDNDIYCTWSLQYRLDHLKNSGKSEVFGSDVRYLPFNNNLFDLVTCNVSLTELQGISRLLKEAWRVLKPEGYFAVCNLSEPFKTSYYQSNKTSSVKLSDIKRFCKAADLFFDYPSFNQLAEKKRFSGKRRIFLFPE